MMAQPIIGARRFDCGDASGSVRLTKAADIW
jgi:hypothetical protein